MCDNNCYKNRRRAIGDLCPFCAPMGLSRSASEGDLAGVLRAGEEAMERRWGWPTPPSNLRASGLRDSADPYENLNRTWGGTSRDWDGTREEPAERNLRRAERILEDLDKTCPPARGSRPLGIQVRAGLKPPKFEAKSGNIQTFFSRYEKYLQQYPEIRDEQKVAFLGTLLCDQSLEFLDSLPVGSYRVVKTRLVDHYRRQGSLPTQWARLTNRRQEKGETETQYYDALILLAKEVEITEDQLMLIFLNGLPSRVHQYIRQGPTTVRTLRTAFAGS